MIVYRFFKKRHGLKSIKDRQLKISNIMDLNDPFELLGVDLSDQGILEALSVIKKDIAKENGIICFSKTWRNPLLWGHYADNHKGICLGFKAPRDLLSEIEYVESRLKCPAFLKTPNLKTPNNIVSGRKFMLKLISTKFFHWQYEEEYRMWAETKEKINRSYYRDFKDKELELTKVIIGCESATTRSEVLDALGNFKGSVDVFTARAAFKSFNVVKNRNKEMWQYPISP